jgi:MYXO-CTERM domain-containing protein
MARTARLAFALAAALAAPRAARAQWRTDPMVVWLDGPRTVLAGSFAGTGAPDLLVVDQPGARSEVRPHHALLARQASAFAPPWLGGDRALRAGYLAQNGGDGLADVARVGVDGVGVVQVAFGDLPGTIRSYAASYPGADEVAAFVHLLPRPADVLVIPDYPNDPTYAAFTALDFAPVAVPTTALARSLTLAPIHLDFLASQGFEAVPLRLSPAARAAGIDDVALLGSGGVVLLVHRAPPATPTLDALQLTTVEVGGNQRGAWDPPWSGARRPPWLPGTIPSPGDTLGVAVADLNGDGNLDLVFAQSILAGDRTYPPIQGAVVWVEGAADPALLGNTTTPWHDLGNELGLEVPLVVRQVSVGETPGVAIWDRKYDPPPPGQQRKVPEVVVVWDDAGVRRIWRAPAPGGFPADIRTVDLVGSPAPDLVVVMDNGTQPGAVLVYPDLGAPGPGLSWAPGSPGTPARGVPHTVTVVLDPSDAASVEWISGLVTSAPVGSGLSHTFPPDCSMPPAPIVATARATDATGVFTELHATVPLGTLQLALALSGAPAPGRLVLPTGGTTAVLVGTAATGCGAAAMGGTPWPAQATVTDDLLPTSIERTVVLPEAAYPALLADPAFIASLATSDPGASPSAIALPLELDASALVEVTHTSEPSSFGDGALAVLRTRLSSRIGVALSSVRIVDALSGLRPAGPPVVSGATVVSSAAGGAELVIDVLPPAPAEVTVELPVQAVGGPGSSGVEARSSGGWLLTPAAPAAARGSPPRPGCGCGAGGDPGAAVLALAGLALRRRRGGRSAT